MGRRTEKFRSIVSAQTAGMQTAEAERRRAGTERMLVSQEQLLGSEAQVAGELGGESADVSPYLGRYTLDENAASVFAGGYDVTPAHEDLRIINDYMQQAEDAARAGDTRGAADFRAKAEQATYGRGGFKYAGGLNISSESIHNLFTFREDQEGIARTRLGSTMARTVGGLVKQGREFLDPESEVSRRYRRSLTEGADRAIATESRAALRQQRDISLQFGAGRALGKERDVAARVQEGFARERAVVHQQAAAQFETFSRMFAMDAVEMGQKWVQGQGQIREGFQSAMDSLAVQSGKFSMQTSQLHQALGVESGVRYEASKARQRQRVKMIAGAALMLATGGLAAAGVMGGAIGTSILQTGGAIGGELLRSGGGG